MTPGGVQRLDRCDRSIQAARARATAWARLKWLRVPNRETAATLAATDRGEDLVRCQDANELFAKLGL